MQIKINTPNGYQVASKSGLSEYVNEYRALARKADHYQDCALNQTLATESVKYLKLYLDVARSMLSYERNIQGVNLATFL